MGLISTSAESMNPRLLCDLCEPCTCMFDPLTSTAILTKPEGSGWHRIYPVQENFTLHCSLRIWAIILRACSVHCSFFTTVNYPREGHYLVKFGRGAKGDISSVPLPRTTLMVNNFSDCKLTEGGALPGKIQLTGGGTTW